MPSAGLELRVVPDLEDQENRSRAGLSYWEGAVTLLDASGRRVADIRPGTNDLRGLAPGVYFLHETTSRTPPAKVILSR